MLNPPSQMPFFRARGWHKPWWFSLQTGLTGTTLHPPLQLREKTSILTCKTVWGPQGDWAFCPIRLPHYEGLSGRSQTLFLVPCASGGWIPKHFCCHFLILCYVALICCFL